MMMTATLRHSDRPRDPRVIYLATWLLWWHYGRQALKMCLLVREVSMRIRLWAVIVLAGMQR